MNRLFRNIIFIVIVIFTKNLYAVPDSKNIFNQGMEAFKSGNYASAELLFRKTEENNDEYKDKT